MNLTKQEIAAVQHWYATVDRMGPAALSLDTTILPALKKILEQVEEQTAFDPYAGKREIYSGPIAGGSNDLGVARGKY